MMPQVDPGALAQEVRALAEEHPDYVYTPSGPGKKCAYHQYDPAGNIVPGAGCIVGEALLRLGVQVSPNENHEGVADLSVLEVPDPYDPTFYWLEIVQMEQDCSKKWQEAVRRADETLAVARESGRVK